MDSIAIREHFLPVHRGVANGIALTRKATDSVGNGVVSPLSITESIAKSSLDLRVNVDVLSAREREK